MSVQQIRKYENRPDWQRKSVNALNMERIVYEQHVCLNEIKVGRCVEMEAAEEIKDVRLNEIEVGRCVGMETARETDEVRLSQLYRGR